MATRGHQIRELLRLKHEGLSYADISTRTGVACSTVKDNAKRATAVGLTWSIAEQLTDEALEAKLRQPAEPPVIEVDMDRARALVKGLDRLGFSSLDDNEEYWSAMQILEGLFVDVARSERAKVMAELRKERVKV